MNELRIISTETPVGEFHMISQEIDGQDVVITSGFGDIEALKLRLPSTVFTTETILRTAQDHPYAALVHRYFEGNKNALSTIPYKQDGGAFAQRAWQEMVKIPWGETISYKELAERSGNESASRAAGAACGSNRIILIVPCHRILKSGGGLGGYVYGLGIKTKLLQLEGAILA